MEYLEEQALEFANKYSKEHINEDVDVVALFEAFKQGAEYQREIDIEKACKWLYENGNATSAYQLRSDGYITPYNEFVEMFRNAMEENKL